VPEKVPFRLTHNIRDGFGLTKEEGVFKCVSELTLRILRNKLFGGTESALLIDAMIGENRSMLMSVLETLIYDPLVDWKVEAARRTRSRPNSTNGKDTGHSSAGDKNAEAEHVREARFTRVVVADCCVA
jgi:serine/threonine-protein kinase ATR